LVGEAYYFPFLEVFPVRDMRDCRSSEEAARDVVSFGVFILKHVGWLPYCMFHLLWSAVIYQIPKSLPPDIRINKISLPYWNCGGHGEKDWCKRYKLVI
jgi:hypothetical protein